MKRFITVILFIFTSVLYSFHCTAQASWQWGKNNNPPFSGIVEAAPTVVDYSGNVFVGGEFSSDSGYIIFGTDTLFSGGDALFVTKNDPAGNFLWAFGTQNSESFVTSIATDSRGDLFVLGQYTDSTCTVGTYTLVNSSPGTAMYFLFKLAPSGAVFWAKNVTSGADNYGGICIDKSDNVYITGNFVLPAVTIGTTTLTNALTTGGSQDFFIAKYNTWGTFEWAKSFGGAGEDFSLGLTFSHDNTICILGNFTSAIINMDGHLLTDSLYGVVVMTDTFQYPFFAKLDTNGNTIWAKDLNRHLLLSGDLGFKTDAFSNIYITGNIDSTITLGSDTLVFTGVTVFIANYDPLGNIIWANSANGGDGCSVSVDSCQHVWIAGSFDVEIYPVIFNGYALSAPVGSTDPMYLAEYNHCGIFLSATALASGADDGLGIAVDNRGNVYVGGDYVNSAMVVGSDTLSYVSDSTEAFFVAKYNYDLASCTHGMPCTLNTQQISETENDVVIFPNPANDECIIHSDAPVLPGTWVEIYDATGRVIKDCSFTGTNVAISLKGVLPGIYQCRIITPGVNVLIKKLVVLR